MRYDFTVAIARNFLKEYGDQDIPQKSYVASGTVFRNRQNKMDNTKNEIRQVSFEYIGCDERTKTDALCLAQALDLLGIIDIARLNIEISDIGLSRAVLSGPYIPPIKSGRLKSALRQHNKFMQLLSHNAEEQGEESLTSLGKLSQEEARKVVSDIFKLTGLKHSGLRSAEEITDRFVKKAEEAQEKPLEPHIANMLARFYNLECPAEQAADKIYTIMSSADIKMDDYLHYFERRLDFLRQADVDVSRLKYGALLKRKPEYYSGFMFSIDSPECPYPLGGGGRYDDLFTVLGSSVKIPAVGCEIRPEEVASLV